MNHTAVLREILDRWAARRMLARRALELTRFCAVLLAALLAAFAADFSLRFGIVARALVLCLAIWLATRAGRRWLSCRGWRRESAVELALALEHRQRLESDLVAALQFDSPAARGWGSTVLQHAVVDYVAEYAKTLQVPRDRPTRGALAWSAGFLAVAALWIALAVVFPAHTAAFAGRFALGDARYPTQSTIDSIELNGSPVSSRSPIKAIAGQPLEFAVRCSGRLPDAGEVAVRSNNGRAIRRELTPAGHRPEIYFAQIPRLAAPVVCEVKLGDAWSEQFDVEPIELPRVELSISATPPGYAVNRWRGAEVTPESTQATVLEGSHVTLELRSQNKPLEKVLLVLEGRQYDFVRTSANRRQWRLSPPPMLQAVHRHVDFTVTAIDVDGLAPAESMTGVIDVESDRVPTVEISAHSTLILPAARPTLDYTISDDVAVARLQIDRELVHEGQAAHLEPIELHNAEMNATVRGSYTLNFGELNLAPGDEVRVTLTATDDRGAAKGRQAVSRPLVFRVTDAAGLLANLDESDAGPSDCGEAMSDPHEEQEAAP